MAGLWARRPRSSRISHETEPEGRPVSKRVILLFLVIIGALGAIGAIKYRQINAAMAMSAGYVPPPETVTTVLSHKEAWQGSLGSIGTITAVHGVEVSADLPGIVEKITFDSGRMVQQGDLLVQLDTRQEKAQLAASEARRDLARASLERMRGLLGKGVASQAEYDAADAEARQAEASVGEVAAAIDRKTIRAPFTGMLGIRRVNLGQYLKGGDPVVPLQSLDPIYVDFSVPQQQITSLRSGGSIVVTADGLPGPGVSGKIMAVDAIIEESTRNVKARATLANPGNRLHPGMFVEVNISLGESAPVIALPASAVNYAPYGDSVFIVEDMKSPAGQTYKGVRQQFVKLGGSRGDQVAVLSGLQEGEEVVTSGVFKLRNGAAVAVNNEVQPGNNPAPKPEDT
jgi:membrane fusion protein (multidrug efflux system)